MDELNSKSICTPTQINCCDLFRNRYFSNNFFDILLPEFSTNVHDKCFNAILKSQALLES